MITGREAAGGPRSRRRAGAGALLFALLAVLGRGAGEAVALPDGRAWELVSPVHKNGGEVAAPGAIAGGGVLQAASTAPAITYNSSTSFGAGAQGAPPASQYIARRTPSGWSTENVTAPLYSGTYDSEEGGVPYRLFSTDLTRGLLSNGKHCRGEAQSGCPVANPPLPGTEAPAGYRNYYLRESGAGAFEALLGQAELAWTAVGPALFDLAFAGASPDLRHVVLSTCAALSAEATEVPLGEGCDPAAQNLYLWSAGGGLSLVNVLPGESEGTPGAALAAGSGAVSADGSRVYWTDLASGDLYLREGGQTVQVDAGAGGGGSLGTASADGSIAFYSKAGRLWRYDAVAEGSSDLTPGGGLLGVLGASPDGKYLYFQDGGGLQLWHEGTVTEIAPGADAADPGNYPPATGTARVSADGSRLLFLSTAPLTGYDNTDQGSPAPCGEPGGVCDSQLFLYDASADSLACLSCNPSGERPAGPSSVPGAIPNGTAPGSPNTYKPRALSSDGRRAFFDSGDELVPGDSNNDRDVYQWEAQGKGSCAQPGGCLALISSGHGTNGASFIDASAEGTDAFFLTDESLVGADPGAVDLYDARIGGGFPEASAPIACEGDSCQFLPSPPADPTLTTLLRGPGNGPVRYPVRCRKGKVKRKGKCVALGHRRHKRHKQRDGRGGKR